LDIKDLRYFTAVFEARSFSRAAEKLDTVQSNVSLRIRNLESRLAVTLFERRYRTVAPTQKGETLYGHAKQLIELLDRTEQSVKPQQDAETTPAPVKTLAS
jgi:DNA-binding transcriptional LysR family regulator